MGRKKGEHLSCYSDELAAGHSANNFRSDYMKGRGSADTAKRPIRILLLLIRSPHLIQDPSNSTHTEKSCTLNLAEFDLNHNPTESRHKPT